MRIRFRKIRASKVNNYAYNLNNKQKKALVLVMLALNAIAVIVLPGAHSVATSVHRQTHSRNITG